jgi:hypothetical protein
LRKLTSAGVAKSRAREVGELVEERKTSILF